MDVLISRLAAGLVLPVCLLLASCQGNARLKAEAEAIVARVEAPAGGVRLRHVQAAAHDLATRGLTYQFGSCRPEQGGMDCSGTVHYLLSRSGYRHVPRQSNHQYFWLQRTGRLKRASDLDEGVLRRLDPGDLLFWEGTYRTGKRYPSKISHVMIYMGKDPRTGRHWMFGGRGTGKRGINGSGIDFFELKPGTGEGRRSRFAGYGRPPGLRG